MDTAKHTDDKKEHAKEKLRYLSPPPPPIQRQEEKRIPSIVDPKNRFIYSTAATMTTVSAFLTVVSLIGAVAFSGRKDLIITSYMSNSRIFFSGLTVASLLTALHYREKDMENERLKRELEN